MGKYGRFAHANIYFPPKKMTFMELISLNDIFHILAKKISYVSGWFWFWFWFSESPFIRTHRLPLCTASIAEIIILTSL